MEASMKLRGVILQEAKRAGILKWLPVFLLVRELMQANEDCRTAASYRALALDFELSESWVYRAITALIKAGWLSANTKARKYTILSLGAAYQAILDEVDFEAANIATNQPEIEHREAVFESLQLIPQISIVDEAANYAKKQSEIVMSEATGVPVVSSSLTCRFIFDVGLTEELKKESPGAKNAPALFSISEFLEAYKTHCPGLIQCREFSDKRIAKLRRECRNHPDIGYWVEVFKRANASAFLRGGSDRGWRAGIEFVIREHVRIIEGSYENKPTRYSAPVISIKTVTPTTVENYDPSEVNFSAKLRQLLASKAKDKASAAQAVA
jgi:hypothetical protein